MAALLYKGFLIIATGVFDKDSRLWLPKADITWWSVAGREYQGIIDSIHSFTTKQEAETFAVEMAKAWVDEHSTTS